MKEEEKNPLENFTQEQIDYVLDLMDKADKCNEKTGTHSNVVIFMPDCTNQSLPLRVDDIALLYIGSRLLPNMVNYLLNIVPQLLYPYVVAYLQNLSDDDHVVTINELFDLVKSLNQENTL